MVCCVCPVNDQRQKWRLFCTAGCFCCTQCREAELVAFLVRIVLSECQRQGERRADWHRYIFALPNDTNTISWLTEQIESHSLFVSLTLCPCLSVSLSLHTHFITLSSHRLSHAHSYATVRMSMCYSHPSGCCLIAFGSAVCRCWNPRTWNLSVYPFSSRRGQCVS